MKHFKNCRGRRDCTCNEEQRYWKVLALCALIVIGELAGSLISGSFALLSDTAHICVDLASVAISIMVTKKIRNLRISDHEERERIEHGIRHRCGQISMVLLYIIGLLIIWEAFRKMHSEKAVEHPLVMASIAFGAYLGNRLQHRVLGHCSHGHDHDHESEVTHRLLDLHVILDKWQNLAVALGGFVIWWKGWVAVDIGLSLMIGAIIVAYSLIYFPRKRNAGI